MDDLIAIIMIIVGAMIFAFVASIVNMVRLSNLKDEIAVLRSRLDESQALLRQLSSTTREAIQQQKPADAILQQESPAQEAILTERIIEARTADMPVADIAGQAEDAHAVSEPIQPEAFPSAPDAQERTIESRIGGSWAVWLGGLTLALGGLFLVKYSIEAGLISPAVRLVLATVFAFALGIGGEWLRRKSLIDPEAHQTRVSIPGLLTAAAAITLFGVVYVAYDFYSYLGSTTAFILLAIIAIATMAIARLHGQALATLGLLGAMATPALISSENPSFEVLFSYLTIAGAAAIISSKGPRWTIVPALAFIGLMIWSLLYIDSPVITNPFLPALAFLALLAATIFIWPADEFQHVESDDVSPTTPLVSTALSTLNRAPLVISLALSYSICQVAFTYIMDFKPSEESPYWFAAPLMMALAALGASRRFAVLPAVAASLGAILFAVLVGPFVERVNFGTPVYFNDNTNIALTLAMSVVFALCGISFFKRKADDDYKFAMIWAAILAIIPALLGAISFANFGVYHFDITHFLFGAALGAGALAGANYFSRYVGRASELGVSALVLLSFLSFTLSLHTVSSALVTTILVPISGYVYFAAARLRPWRALPWMLVPALLITMGRFAWEPTIVGADFLSKTVAFNQLLPGYGVAALVAIIAAYQMRNSQELKLKNCLQAFAAILSLLTAAILVRHGMNGGKLDSVEPTLGEQSIYTILMIGLSTIMLFLDRRDGSSVLRYGSMLASVLSVLSVVAGHLIGLNPYYTGELTGPWPILNLILIAYLIPAAGYGLIAFYAKDIRPRPYVRFISAAAALMAFAWVTLEVRHFWQGTSIADWKGFTPSETYSYTVVWILLGVALLIIGVKRQAMVLRLASALLLVLATAKAFLFDMSNLEGALRALSFIGLGLVLMGIGLFYQKILAKPDPRKTDGVENGSEIAGA